MGIYRNSYRKLWIYMKIYGDIESIDLCRNPSRKLWVLDSHAKKYIWELGYLDSHAGNPYRNLGT